MRRYYGVHRTSFGTFWCTPNTHASWKWEKKWCILFCLNKIVCVCFEFRVLDSAVMQLNLTVLKNFRPFAVIIFRQAVVTNENEIVFSLMCFSFFRIHIVSVRVGFIRLPFFFAYVMPWLLWLYRHLTLRRTNSRHSIHMLIKTTTYSYILAHRFTEKERKRKKNNNNEEKTLREADLFYTKKRKNKIGMFYRTTSSSSHSHLALPPPCVVETKANKKKKNSTLKCRWNTKPFKIPGLLLYYFFFISPLVLLTECVCISVVEF